MTHFLRLLVMSYHNERGWSSVFLRAVLDCVILRPYARNQSFRADPSILLKFSLKLLSIHLIAGNEGFICHLSVDVRSVLILSSSDCIMVLKHAKGIKHRLLSFQDFIDLFISDCLIKDPFREKLL